MQARKSIPALGNIPRPPIQFCWVHAAACELVFQCHVFCHWSSVNRCWKAGRHKTWNGFQNALCAAWAGMMTNMWLLQSSQTSESLPATELIAPSKLQITFLRTLNVLLLNPQEKTVQIGLQNGSSSTAFVLEMNSTLLLDLLCSCVFRFFRPHAASFSLWLRLSNNLWKRVQSHPTEPTPQNSWTMEATWWATLLVGHQELGVNWCRNSHKW